MFQVDPKVRQNAPRPPIDVPDRGSSVLIHKPEALARRIAHPLRVLRGRHFFSSRHTPYAVAVKKLEFPLTTSDGTPERASNFVKTPKTQNLIGIVLCLNFAFATTFNLLLGQRSFYLTRGKAVSACLTRSFKILFACSRAFEWSAESMTFVTSPGSAARSVRTAAVALPPFLGRHSV